MKKFFILFFLPALFSFIHTNTLTDAERKFAIDHLKQTQADLVAAVQGLSDVQLNFKPAPDRWSILECVQHIMLSSKSLWESQQIAMMERNDSNWKASFPDDSVIKLLEDRTHKAQAPEPLKPVHSPYKTLDKTLKVFNKDRDKLIDYVRTSRDDMRNHFIKAWLDVFDTYQWILIISAHTNRHTQQINEVKADPNFPKQ
ncbi:MAG: DinB family protein [Ginsengibacter sp.]